jgi:hypothetical protein
MIFEWNHPDAPGAWMLYYSPPSGTGNSNTFGTDGNAMLAAVHGRTNSTNTLPRLLTRDFFASDDEYYQQQTNESFSSLPMNGSAAVKASGSEIAVWVRSGGTVKRNKVYPFPEGSSTGWVSSGSCTNATSSPSIGNEGAGSSHWYPYFACGSALCRQFDNSGCTTLGGTLRSAPTVVNHNGFDLIFYKGGNNNAFMYTSVSGHQDLGLALP